MLRSSLLLCCFILFHEDVAASAIEQFKAFNANLKSAKGSFVQIKMKTINGATVPDKFSYGTFMFSRPGKFIWEYEKPYQQVLQSDGTKFYLYDKDLNQVTIKQIGSAISASPAGILFGESNIEKNFTLRDSETKESVEWLEAIPTDKESQFIKINIGMKNGLPTGMELFDSLGNLSVISLGSIDRQPKFSVNQFKFVIPGNADIIGQ